MPLENNKHKYPESCLYWLHLPEHTNPLSQGYIGVSVKGADKRFANHKWHAAHGSNLKVHCAIRKYGDSIVCTTLIKADPDYCLLMENKFRPELGMETTWNLAVGGVAPNLGGTISEAAKVAISKANKGRIPSVETRQKMSKAQTGRTWSEQHRHNAKIAGRKPHSETAKRKMKDSWDKGRDWIHPRAKSCNWLQALSVYDYVVKNPEHGCERSMMSVGLPRTSSTTVYNKIKSGWNPNLDQAYLTWLSNYNQNKET